MRSLLIGAVVVVGAATLHAQTTQVAPLTLAGELSKLAAEAEMLRSALPSFGCTEVFSSKESKDGEVKRRVEMKVNLRVLRQPDGKMKESFEPTERDGKPFTGKANLPLYVSGGFQAALNYVAADRQPCYRYTLTPGRLEFESAAAAAAAPACQKDLGIRGFALLDGAGEITHIERQVLDDDPHPTTLAPFAAVDLAPVELKGKTFRLSTRLRSVYLLKSSTLEFEGFYTNCRLFAAEVTMRPGPGTVGDGAVDPPKP